MIEKLFLGLRHKNDFDIRTVFKDQMQLSKISTLINKWFETGYVERGSVISKINLTPLGYLMCDSLLDEIFREVEF